MWLFPLVLGLWVVLWLAWEKAREQWAGSIQKENGLTIVKNPEKPHFSQETLQQE